VNRTLPLIFSLLLLAASCRTVTPPPATWRPEAVRARPALSDSAQWTLPGSLDSIIASMTLEEKVAQMVMVRSYGHYFSTDSDAYERLVRLVRERRIGGLIMAQGDVYEEAVLINRLQSLARIPLLVAGDFERGIAMRVRRGTSFPDAMALGATRRPELAYRMGKVVAMEARAIGIHQNYAPVADINTNPDNPVINTRAFGDDPSLVRDMVTAFVRGTADGGGIATVKHFPGHGDTGLDSHLDLPVLSYRRSRLDTVELMSFRAALDSGARSVMVAHIAVPALDSLGFPASLSQLMIGGVLRKEYSFTGLVITDALEMQGILRRYSPGRSAVLAARAGVDILLVPPDEDAAVASIVSAVRGGEIPEEGIDASVQRILACKQSLGLDRQRYVDIDAIAERVATRPNRELAKQIAREGITVLRNAGGILPLAPNGRKRIAAVLVSDVEDNRIDVNRAGTPATTEMYGSYFTQLLRRRAGTVEAIRLTPASDAPEFENALARMRTADLTLLCLYIKVRSSTGKIGIPEYVRQFLAQAGEVKKPLVVCIFGNPYIAGDFPAADGVLCAYGDNEALGEAAAEALWGEIPVRGKLPVTIPGRYAFGAGIDIPQSQLRRDEPSAAGFDDEDLSRVDEIVRQAIADSALPGGQVAIVKDGLLVYNKSFGTQTYEQGSRVVDANTMYDLASVTKGVATTAALMRLYDQKKIDIDYPVVRYIPSFGGGERDAITIRHLLLHRGGLPPFRQLWKICPDAASAMDTVIATPLVAHPGDTTIYTDLGMIILGRLVEEVAGMPLDLYVKREFFDPLRMTCTMYRPDASLRDRIAPTEVDTVWRKGLVQGTVHDENAAFLGGVSGNAGLFSTASDLAVFMQMMLNKGTYAGRRYISEGTMYEFLGRRLPRQQRWLGWDMKSATGSSAGSFFSPASFGHTGFTGTSVWADPDRHLAVVFLTNRVYPTRANTRLHAVRPALHDAVMHALGLTSPTR